MSLFFNIAIDGHSSCGKSTIAKSIARKYKMRYIDTGAMYRAVTLYCMREKIIDNSIIDTDKLLEKIDNLNIDFRYNTNLQKSETFLNNQNVEDLIRGIDVSENVSNIAKIKEVRSKLVSLQKRMGLNKNVVMDGRDIGTKVFPDAKLKLFITAKVEVRAQRRYNELVDKGERVNYSEVLKNINTRDFNDSNREFNPLVKSDDALLIDNSHISINDQNILIEDLINKIK
ncbi:MAG: (d)CMP kinase [Flavobacteriales bacterium]|jgi:cytidylate kinase|nr:(d)CMP kinase [Flavobacteriales bacterium]|tara:strand:+ start:101 stop:787 length:687 start_codon:yes stop_codon:yes gene_type:complete